MKLSYLPERGSKPRSTGITMIIDKGLSVGQVHELISVAGHLIDFAKLGFGTSVICEQSKEKVKIYRDNGIKVFLGGTLFEASAVRDMVKEYKNFVQELGVDAVEISDGSIIMDHAKKCEYINDFSKNYTVLSEVGAKEDDIFVKPDEWSDHMQKELDAGSTYVIAEARETGTVGIYKQDGTADISLINDILKKIPSKQIMWETPLKQQQAWFIKLIGAKANLGNILPDDVIPLETIRLGLRSDTFFEFLPEECQKYKLKKKKK